MVKPRALRQDEINEAQKVFNGSINYQQVFIQEYGDGAMTWAYQDVFGKWYWVIFWSSDVFNKGTLFNPLVKRTFIHEMTHVWQGNTEHYHENIWLVH